MAFFSEKTEAPTPRRREEARRRGTVAKSAEVNAVCVMIAGFATVYVRASQTRALLADNLSCIFMSALSPGRDMFFDVVGQRSITLIMSLLLPALLVMLATAVAVNFLQTGFLLTGKPLTPDFSRVSPAAGMQRMFSSIALGELVKSLLKLGLVGWVAYAVFRGAWESVLMTAQMGLSEGVATGAGIGVTLAKRLLLVLSLLATGDYAMQRFRTEARLRLTRQELKEEVRQMEGDPRLRSRVMARQRQMAMQRMMQQVPKADAVVTNPTHIAVALRYDPVSMQAPQVLAKGVDFMAQRILLLARQHSIPIVQNPPLAQALHKAVSVGGHIPPQLYQAVAEVLAYVYRLTGRTREYAKRETQ